MEGGRGHLVIGHRDGSVELMDRDFHISVQWQAYSGGAVTHIAHLFQSEVLITLGFESESSIDPKLCFWSLAGLNKHCEEQAQVQHQQLTKSSPLLDAQGTDVIGSWQPELLKELVVILPADARSGLAKPSCLAVLEDLSQVVVGFHNGFLVLVRASSVLRERQPRQITLQKAGSPGISAISFRTYGQSTTLFAVTRSTVESFESTSRTLQIKHHKLDPYEGAEPGMVAIDQNRDLVICRGDAVYFYGAEGKGRCIALPGEKLRIGWFGNYLLVVSRPPRIPSRMQFSIIDLQNRFIAFSQNFDGVTQLTSEWGAIHLLTSSGKIYRLREKDNDTNLSIVFRRKLFKLALSLATSRQYDNQSVMDIYRKYGDYLYEEEKCDEAMQQYEKTIGHLEPSYVIRKYLDSKRIHNLTFYLERLHEAGLANSVHTTLLLNCYTKLKDQTKLSKFVSASSRTTFDPVTAIREMREAGYYEQATQVAARHQLHDSLIKILVENLGQHAAALEYIATLPFSEATEMVRLYGVQLVQHLPQETTELLKRLCTKYRPKANLELIDTKPTTTSALSSLTGVLGSHSDTAGAAAGAPGHPLAAGTTTPGAPAASATPAGGGGGAGGGLRLSIPGARNSSDQADMARSRSPRGRSATPLSSSAAAGASSLQAALASSFDKDVPETNIRVPTNSVSRYQYAQPRSGTLVVWSLRPLDGRAFYRVRLDGALIAEDEVKEEGSFGQVRLERDHPVNGPFVLEIENRSVLQEKTVATRLEVRSLNAPGRFESREEERARPETFIPLYARQHDWLERFLEFVCARYQDETPSTVYDTLLELYLRDEIDSSNSNSASSSNSNAPDAHDSGSAAQAELEESLPAAAVHAVLRDPAAQAKHRDEVAARRDKALDLLKKNSANYDKSHALVLCETSHFTKGILVLYEALGVYHENIAYHMDHKEFDHVIETCQKYGHDHPKLWTWALSYLTHQEASGEVSARLSEVLSYIDEHNLLSPLLVVDILAQNPTIELRVIQEFISRRVQLQQNQIHDDEQLTAEFTARTTRMREQLRELTDGAVEFKEDRCGVCREPLELPSVHFLCKHSFHEGCIDMETEQEPLCPLCRDEYDTVLGRRARQRSKRNDHDEFTGMLKNSVDGFATVAEFFGQGLLGQDSDSRGTATHDASDKVDSYGSSNRSGRYSDRECRPENA